MIAGYQRDYYTLIAAALPVSGPCRERSAPPEGGPRENCTRVERPSARQPTYKSGQLTLSGHPWTQTAIGSHAHAFSPYLSFSRSRSAASQRDDARGGRSRTGERSRWFTRAYISATDISARGERCDVGPRAKTIQNKPQPRDANGVINAKTKRK